MSATLIVLTGLEMLALNGDGDPDVTNRDGDPIALTLAGTPRPSKTTFAVLYNLDDLGDASADRGINFRIKIPQGFNTSDPNAVSAFTPLAWLQPVRTTSGGGYVNGPIVGTNIQITDADIPAGLMTVRLIIDQYQTQIVEGDPDPEIEITEADSAQGYLFVDFKHSLV